MSPSLKRIHSYKMHLSVFCAILQTKEKTEFPTLSCTLTNEIPTLLYT